jgi:hypothetical protein
MLFSFRRRFGLGATRIGSPSEGGGVADAKLDALRHGFLWGGTTERWVSVEIGSYHWTVSPIGQMRHWFRRGIQVTITMDIERIAVPSGMMCSRLQRD